MSATYMYKVMRLQFVHYKLVTVTAEREVVSSIGLQPASVITLSVTPERAPAIGTTLYLTVGDAASETT